MNIKRLIEMGSYRGLAASPRPAGARPAHPHQRPHPQGTAPRHRRQQEEGDGEDLRTITTWRKHRQKPAKKKTFKKKEKKIVSNGPRAHPGVVQQHDRDHHRSGRATCCPGRAPGSLGFRGSRKGTPFAAQQASLTAANKAKECGSADGGSAGQRSGLGPRIGGARAVDGGYRSAVDQGSHADSAQRLPAAEEAPRLGVARLGPRGP